MCSIVKMDEFFGFEETVQCENCEIVASNRKGLKLLHEGHVYNKDKQVSK